jgi:glycosyltransferase involved in cell wall biosynthesis
MKILNVVDGSGWTGGVEQTLLLTREMVKKGIDARLAGHKRNPVVQEAQEAGLQAYCYQGYGSRFSDLYRLNTILKENYDLVIGHKPAALRDLVPLMKISRRGTPLLGVRRVSFPVSRLTTYLFPDHVVAVADFVRDVLVRSGLKSTDISVIPSGVDLERFLPDRQSRLKTRKKLSIEGKTVILNLAKFVPAQKGQDILFSALSRLEGNDPIVLLLAGLDTDSGEAERAVHSYGLGDKVRLLGFRRDIPELLNAADLFVFPSLPGLDAIAGSVLQAMACEKPVVASGIGGIPEYLQDGKNGLLIKPGDSPALQRAITAILGMTAKEKAKMGTAAGETVRRRYSAEAMAEGYLRLVERMLGRNS